MGRLRGLKTGEEIELPGRALIGRSEACWIRADHDLTSKEHARIHWTGDEWVLRDLGSTNGTFVAGERLDPGVEHPLKAGAQIAFGDPDEGVYELTSDTPPCAIARRIEDGEVVAAEHNLLVLPDDENPEVTVFQTADGSWQIEDDADEVRPANPGQTLRAGGHLWKLELPAPSDRTPIAESIVSLATVDLRLRVSKDQEHVDIALLNGPKAISLGPKWYGYLLLVLARARQEDAERPISERGWIKMSDLARMLKLDSNAINVATHRARRELAAQGLLDAAGVVEIKRGFRRIGTDRLRVEQLDD